MEQNSNPIEYLIEFAWANGADRFVVNNAKDELKKLKEKNEELTLEVFKAKKFAVAETTRWLSCEKEIAQLKQIIRKNNG
jgi:hypothetical protein